MKKRDKERNAKRWAWERIIEALDGLRLTDWPLDDEEFSDITGSDRELFEKSVDACIESLKTQYAGRKEES